MDESVETLPAQVMHEGDRNLAKAIGAVVVNSVADFLQQTGALIRWPISAANAHQRIGVVEDELESRLCQ